MDTNPFSRFFVEYKKIGKRIVLTHNEQRICKYIARERYEFARKHNYKNKIPKKNGYSLTDLNGYGGEFAFCKLFNLYPDLSTELHKDSVYDCTMYEDWKIDVKTTHYERGHLCVGEWIKRKEGLDAFALMVGKFPQYQFKGFISKERGTSSKYLKDKGMGLAYFIPQHDLMEFDMLYLNDFT